MDAHIFITEEMGDLPQESVEETVQEPVLPTNNVVPVSDQLHQATVEAKPKFRLLLFVCSCRSSKYFLSIFCTPFLLGRPLSLSCINSFGT